MLSKDVDKKKVLEILNHILEMEMASMVRYNHYSLMVYGYNRIPIVGWLREQGAEALMHAQQAGELITSIGGHPSLGIGPLLETHKHDIGDILREALETEKASIKMYRELLEMVEGKSILLEEYARNMVYQEELHTAEVDKMLRKPGAVDTFDDR